MKRKQGNTTNKLIVTFKDYSPKKFGTERESFKCNSIEKASAILSKRDNRRIFFATFFDNKGIKTTFDINTKDTILSI